MDLKRRRDTAMSGPLETIQAAKLNGPDLSSPNSKHEPAVKLANIAVLSLQAAPMAGPDGSALIDVGKRTGK
jgi:hypothetical protein